jgi:hypothetical protein
VYDRPDANLALKFLACSDPEHWAQRNRDTLTVTHTGENARKNDSDSQDPSWETCSRALSRY